MRNLLGFKFVQNSIPYTKSYPKLKYYTLTKIVEISQAENLTSYIGYNMPRSEFYISPSYYTSKYKMVVVAVCVSLMHKQAERPSVDGI